MNKTGFINKLQTEANVDLNTATIINDIIEEYPFFNKKYKDKIVATFVERLEVDEEQAENYYNISISIINDAIKNKIKHPFKSQD